MKKKLLTALLGFLVLSLSALAQQPFAPTQRYCDECGGEIKRSCKKCPHCGSWQ